MRNAHIFGGEKQAPLSHRWGTELHQILGGHRTVIGAPRIDLSCLLCVGTRSSKIQILINFALFDLFLGRDWRSVRVKRKINHSCSRWCFRCSICRSISKL